MIRINLLAVGTLKERYWREALAEYEKRISRFAAFKVVETAEKRTVAEEGAELLKKCAGVKIAFDIGGELIDSERLASTIDKYAKSGRSELTFIIGGSDGLSDEVKSACDERISFGRVTYPHQMMRVIASEQLYRALTIINGVPYHK